MRKIMILTAERTGNGHKSAANALEVKLNSLNYETKQFDCFPMMGKLGTLLENSYLPITTSFPILYYIPFLFTQICPDIMHALVYLKIKKKLKQEIDKFKPDLIISVHSMFTKSISHLLKNKKMDIPFYITVIDLVNPPKVWFDKNADVIFVPTEEVRNDYLKKGISSNKIFVSGFPIKEDIHRRKTPKTIKDKVNILMVNPSVNLSKNIKYVKEVSRLDNADVTVICGRNEKLYKTLKKEQELGKISKNINIYGFVNNINEFLENSHIILTKAGPNMILEAVKSATAVVITGHVKGQENWNYKYVLKNKYGFKCENPRKIYNKLYNFINGQELKQCLKNVLNTNCDNGTEFIVNYIQENKENK